MKHALIVNLAGVPGVGKSTGAAYVFSQLKMKGINAELVSEVAKDATWENNKVALKNSAYLFGAQSLSISRCEDKVDVIVTDSPLFLAILYKDSFRFKDSFDKCVIDTFKSYNNLTFLVERSKPYSTSGRNQTELESNELIRPLNELIEKYNIECKRVRGDLIGYNIIVGETLNELKRRGIKLDEM